MCDLLLSPTDFPISVFPPFEGSDDLNVAYPEAPAPHQDACFAVLQTTNSNPTPPTHTHTDLRELQLRALAFKLSVLQIWMSGGAQGPNSKEVVNLIRKPFANL